MTPETDILAELRAWRDEFARSHGYDLSAMVATLRSMELRPGAVVVRGTARPPMPNGFPVPASGTQTRSSSVAG